MCRDARLSILFVALSMLCTPLWAAIDTASGGNWTAASTWKSMSQPSNNDTLIIPSGVTVRVNCNCASLSNVQVNVYGELRFNNGRKLNLSSNGTVNVFTGGTLRGGNGGSKLNIGGSTVWDGNDPDINGPETCDNGGCATNAVLPVTLVAFEARSASFGHEIAWTTATEKNADYFLLEASNDLEYWVTTCLINAAGHSSEPLDYACMDASEHTYYRLLQVDFDGASEVFGPITVRNRVQSTTGDLRTVHAGSELRITSGSDMLIHRVRLLLPSGEVVADMRPMRYVAAIPVSGIGNSLIVVLVELADGDVRSFKFLLGS